MIREKIVAAQAGKFGIVGRRGALSLLCLAVALAFGQGCVCPATRARTISFASWNIGHFALGTDLKSHIVPEDAERQGRAYREFIASVGADILGVVEYSAAFTTNGAVRADAAVFDRYARRIVGPQHGYQWNAQFWGLGEIVESRMVEYEKHLQDVYYIATRVKVDGTEIVFVETHLDWCTYPEGHEDDRASQMRRLVADFKDEPHVVIAGDFNIGIRSADRSKKTIDNPTEYDVFKEAGFTLGNDGRYKTFPAGRLDQPERSYALDNIIVKGLEIRDFKVHDRPDLSDHALVSATLVLPDKEGKSKSEK